MSNSNQRRIITIPSYDGQDTRISINVHPPPNAYRGGSDYSDVRHDGSGQAIQDKPRQSIMYNREFNSARKRQPSDGMDIPSYYYKEDSYAPREQGYPRTPNSLRGKRVSIAQEPRLGGARTSRVSRLSIGGVDNRPVSAAYSMGESIGGDPMHEAILAKEEATSDRYAWWILAACSSIAASCIGMTYLWGIYQNALVAEGVASSATLSYVGSLSMSCVALFGIVNAKLMTIIGVRKSALLGSILFSSAMTFAGFATKSIAGLFILIGILQGYGLSLLFLAISTLPAQYFVKKKGFAVGVIYASGGLGGAIFGVIMQQVISKIGVAWCFRITGLISFLLTFPAAFIMKERTKRTAPFIDFTLFEDPRYVILCIIGALGTFSLLGPPFLAPSYAEAIGQSASTGAYLVSLYNLASAAGRLFFGWVSDKIGEFNTIFFNVQLTVLSLLALWPVSDSLAPFVIFIILNGFSSGGYFSVMPVICHFIVGDEKHLTAYGMFLTTWGLGYILGAPIAGYLVQAETGSSNIQVAKPNDYRPAMWFAGGIALLQLCIVLLLNASILRKNAEVEAVTIEKGVIEEEQEMKDIRKVDGNLKDEEHYNEGYNNDEYPNDKKKRYSEDYNTKPRIKISDYDRRQNEHHNHDEQGHHGHSHNH